MSRLRIDSNSTAWRLVHKHLLERISELRAALEQDADLTTTANLRGRISELRELIRDVEPAPDADQTDTSTSVLFT